MATAATTTRIFETILAHRVQIDEIVSRARRQIETVWRIADRLDLFGAFKALSVYSYTNGIITKYSIFDP